MGAEQSSQVLGEKPLCEEDRYQNALSGSQSGDLNAKVVLAWFMLAGRGGAQKDENGAVALLEECVANGNIEAMWMLGVCCLFGLGMTKDAERGLSLFGKSADSGNIIGSYLKTWYPKCLGNNEYFSGLRQQLRSQNCS